MNRKLNRTTLLFAVMGLASASTAVAAQTQQYRTQDNNGQYYYYDKWGRPYTYDESGRAAYSQNAAVQDYSAQSSANYYQQNPNNYNPQQYQYQNQNTYNQQNYNNQNGKPLQLTDPRYSSTNYTTFSTMNPSPVAQTPAPNYNTQGQYNQGQYNQNYTSQNTNQNPQNFQNSQTVNRTLSTDPSQINHFQNMSTPMASETVDDQVITNAVRQALANSKALSNSGRNVQVSTSNGIVTLTGTVNSQDEKNKVESLTIQTTGVTKVINKLNIFK
jgi:osmotically-inducible protein OsmY